MKIFCDSPYSNVSQIYSNSKHLDYERKFDLGTAGKDTMVIQWFICTQYLFGNGRFRLASTA